MNQYETGFIIAPNLSEEETSALIVQMAEVVSAKKGRMIKQDLWGKRKLAYPIKRYQEGFYVFFNYEGTPVVPAELERKFKQTDPILRFMTVRKSPGELKQGKKKEKTLEPASPEPAPAPAPAAPEQNDEEGK
ncbi:MAG: 30S ribosomal protein S6 [Candidatus Saccharicenans sp.]|jgi:small subunit ribosomal protein S6|nr:30S ribosomal protein S6 [Candidatus Saccharicenans sp.]